jgi:cyclopropane fatty-acyl-phospholipid synthase-like methyltransferase
MTAIDRSLLNSGFPDCNWGNLGLWTAVTQDYPGACEALAVMLAQRAQMEPGCSVLDVGFGYGDQLLVWKQQFGVGSITGIEIDAAGVAHARNRLDEFKDVSLYLGAGDLRTSTERYDRVVALDCAYHFASRSVFFAMSASALNPGGVIALTDIVLADGARAADHALLAKICGIPLQNLLTQRAYAQSLLDLGFCNVQFEQLDEQVLRGFSRFALRLLRSRGTAVLNAGGLKILATAAIAAWLGRSQKIHYTLVSAMRPDIRRATASADVTALSSKGTPGDA